MLDPALRQKDRGENEKMAPLTPSNEFAKQDDLTRLFLRFAREDDATALEDLFRQSADKAYTIARYVLDNEADSEDAVLLTGALAGRPVALDELWVGSASTSKTLVRSHGYL